MSNLFSTVLNMSMTGSVVILLVMLARLILKRAPKIFSYALWSVVLFRLLCPVAFTAPVSVLNALEPEVQEASESTSVVYFLPAEVNQNQEFTFVPAENQSGTELVQAGESEHTRLDLMTVVSYVWITGTGIMILYSVIQYIRLRLKLVGAVAYRGNVYRADYIDTPFVMGIFSPKIYLPSDVPMNERKYIIAHERHHIRRCDHIIKLLAYLALCIHWFNPMVWAAFILAGKDMEMSCDEAVIRKMGSQIRADYSASLLRLATHKKIIAGIPLAFGEGDTKGRVMNMAKWKKPKLWVSVICLVLCTAVLVACAVNPQNQTELMHSGEIIFGNLRVPLPNGYTYQDNEDGSISIAYEGNIVAGIVRREKPEISIDRGIVEGEIYTGNNFKEWVIALGLPEAQEDAHYTGMIGDTIYGNLEAEYWNGQNPEKYNVIHYFYIHDTAVYDVWCDLNLLPNREVHPIMGHIELLEDNAASTITESIPSESFVSGNPVITDTELVQYGTLKMLLPSGFAATYENDAVVLTKDSVAVGGIRHWKYPEFQPSDIVELKKEESGAPIGYMSGSSAYGDMEYEIFWDGNPEGLNEQHTFFIDGDIIYDVWYDQNLISDGIAERFLKTVAINAEPVVVTEPGEQEAFAKCLAVLEAVQKGSYKVVTLQTNGRNENVMRHERTYSRSGADWLSITYVLPVGADFSGEEKYSTTSSRLCVNGKYFGFTGAEWVEIAEIENERLPWLAEFKWDENIVAYMDTLTDEDGECVMLRVDEKYIESDEYDPHYFLYFNFDPDGNFVSAQLQINLFRDNEISITESIVSLDPEVVNAEIQDEYQKAIG